MFKVHIFWEGHKILQNLQYIQSKVRGRFRKILWPSQNIWTLHKMANIDVIRVLFDLKECILHSCEYSFKNSFIWLALPIQCIATALLFIESNKPTSIYTKSLHKNFIFIPKVCLRISCWKHTKGYLLGFPHWNICNGTIILAWI